jgi:hypothetical protein
MDQILLRRRDKHTSRLSAERIPSPSPMPVLKACNNTCASSPLRREKLKPKDSRQDTVERWGGRGQRHVFRWTPKRPLRVRRRTCFRPLVSPPLAASESRRGVGPSHPS